MKCSVTASTSSSGGTRSPRETPLWDAIESWVAEVDPGARPAPICLAGFTDSHWPRAAFGTVAYGFFPMRHMDPQLATRLVHSTLLHGQQPLGIGGRTPPVHRHCPTNCARR